MKRVYLPNLRKIVVNNYSLYTQNPTFEFSFKEGISAVVGANGIGKTTFVNMIIYALIGFRDEESKSRKVNSIRDATLKDINFF
uniref:AAA family ATPase n=1 Tax=Clostridium sp. NkU-1 TaxID=1095009 RepID=UPI0006D2ACEF